MKTLMDVKAVWQQMERMEVGIVELARRLGIRTRTANRWCTRGITCKRDLLAFEGFCQTNSFVVEWVDEEPLIYCSVQALDRAMRCMPGERRNWTRQGVSFASEDVRLRIRREFSRAARRVLLLRGFSVTEDNEHWLVEQIEGGENIVVGGLGYSEVLDLRLGSEFSGRLADRVQVSVGSTQFSFDVRTPKDAEALHHLLSQRGLPFSVLELL